MTTISQAVTAGAPELRLTFGYDYMSRRVSKKVEQRVAGQWRLLHDRRFVYDGWNLVAIYIHHFSSNILHTSFIWGEDLSGTMQGGGGVGGLLAIRDHIEGKTFLPAYDGNGNVTGLVDAASGTVAATYEYDPFGNLIAQTGAYAQVNPFRFSTKYTDNESDLVYYGYRYLDTGIGRWINRDPIKEEGGVNLYGFVGNDAVNNLDILGQSCAWSRILANGISLQPFWGTDWRYKHCLANCVIVRCCGRSAAEDWSIWKEERDLAACDQYYQRTGLRNSGACYSAYQPSDFEDNEKGRSFAADARSDSQCKSRCAFLKGQPDGPPGPYYIEYVEPRPWPPTGRGPKIVP